MNHFYIDWKMIRITLVLVSLIPFVLAVRATTRIACTSHIGMNGLALERCSFPTLRGHSAFPTSSISTTRARRAFPYLVYITLAKIHGWDVRDGMVISLLEAAAICGLLFWLFLRTKGATAITALIALTLTSFLVFSPVQYDNFLSGILFELFIPGLATILIALVNLSRLRFGIKTTINAIVP